jgi:hypothetical protein
MKIYHDKDSQVIALRLLGRLLGIIIPRLVSEARNLINP